MSEARDMPQEIWDAAASAWDGACTSEPRMDTAAMVRDTVRAAVLAEREACARVAAQLQYDLVARRIRKRGEG